MKITKYFAALLLIGLTLSSCKKEDVENTSTVSMAGQWYVDIDAVDENGAPIPGGEHYFGYDEERVLLLTYNTSADNGTEMFVDDLEAFDVAGYYSYAAYPNYAIKCRVNINQNDLTFSASNAANLTGDYNVTIEDGKILKGAGRQKNGSPADSIVFYVKYEGDPWFPGDGYAKYKVSGIRYSGLVEND
jgi:hypothetical protein